MSVCRNVLFAILSLVFTVTGCSPDMVEWDFERDGPRQAVEIPHEPYVALDHSMRDISSWELVKEIKAGWNLGNTFESRGLGLNAERAWGNPRTTFAMIQAVKKAGFDSVRIPVTWQRQLSEAPDYLIDKDWLDRVEEVVGYVLTNDMYCIINIHHEDWIITTEENEQQTTGQLVAVWEQLSVRFKDYNEKLIFEGMSEPRTKDCMYEWEGGKPEDRQVVNRLNQAFIKVVRDSGSRNELRHLMIPTYAASAENPAMVSLAVAFPKDDDKIIASIHAYTPYYFTLISGEQGIDKWFPNVDEPEIDSLFVRLNENFLENNIPIIIGETGTRDRNGNLKARVLWTKYYFKKARDYGIPTFWWDNGKFSSLSERADDFGLLDRYEAKFVYPDIVDAIMGR